MIDVNVWDRGFNVEDAAFALEIEVVTGFIQEDLNKVGQRGVFSDTNHVSDLSANSSFRVH